LRSGLGGASLSGAGLSDSLSSSVGSGLSDCLGGTSLSGTSLSRSSLSRSSLGSARLTGGSWQSRAAAGCSGASGSAQLGEDEFSVLIGYS